MTPTEIILHCSATAEGKDFRAKDIDQWHKQRGFNKIGYHYVVDLDGTIEKGRADNEVGAHCLNHNSKALGICYIGGLASDGKTPKDTRTEAQKEALNTLVEELMDKYKISLDNVFGHYQFCNYKSCPCFKIESFKTEFENWKKQKNNSNSNVNIQSKIIADLFMKQVQNDIRNLGK